MNAVSMRHLAKAQESLASAEADAEAMRYNSAANRSYYAAFQAAVAILIRESVTPPAGTWEHRFVISQVSGKLIGQRKVVHSCFRGALDALLEMRMTADYRSASVGAKDAKAAVRQAREFVGEVTRLLAGGANG